MKVNFLVALSFAAALPFAAAALLDWSGAENKESRGDLIEYLKIAAVAEAPPKSAAPGIQDASAREVVPEGEEEVIAELRARHLKGHHVKPGPKLRGEHPKQHAGLSATFRVEKNLAPEFRVGVFAEPRTYSALVRFSNGRGFDDNKPEVHGAAVKVLIPVAGAAEPQQQDFITADNPVFFARDARHFLELLNVSERVPPVSPLTTHPLLKTFAKPATSSLLAMTYWSQTPYKLGDGAVKYMLTPSVSEDRPPIPLGTSPDFLREALMEQLTVQKRGASFDLCILPQTDPATMPIEDPTIEWTSKPVRVATVSIHPQRFDSTEQMSFFENLFWSPWNARPEHAPIGGINRARRLIYEESSALRHKETGLAPIVPTGRESF